MSNYIIIKIPQEDMDLAIEDTAYMSRYRWSKDAVMDSSILLGLWNNNLLRHIDDIYVVDWTRCMWRGYGTLKIDIED